MLRRSFLQAMGFAGLSRWRPEPVSGPSESLAFFPLRVEGRLAIVGVPKDDDGDRPRPLLVVLHGLGETHDERTGAWAFVERYGLGRAFDRLRKPPIRATPGRREWTRARLDEVNSQLGANRFEGMVVACPYLPRLRPTSENLDAYANWLADALVPAVGELTPIRPEISQTSLDGCSFGGWLGLEFFLRRADRFGAWGGVQSAFGAGQVTPYADRIAHTLERVGPRAIHVQTSSHDPFRVPNEHLVTELVARGVEADGLVLPGFHDQPWLREAGSLEMLLWHDRFFSLAKRPNPR